MDQEEDEAFSWRGLEGDAGGETYIFMGELTSTDSIAPRNFSFFLFSVSFSLNSFLLNYICIHYI